ncbi:MAG: hydroxymethylbilane synthase [Thermodesulfobacteriota bacterium]
MASPRTLKIGTRGSPLALWQAKHVAERLAALFPGVASELCIIKTKGDKILDTPLAQVGGKGLFIKEIEDALLSGRADLAVHSMKDVPGEIPQGLTIAAVPEREDPRDAILCRNAEGLADLPRGARVGTSSLRRAAQLLALRPDLVIEPLRGNVGTRLTRLDEGRFDAIVLAAAGVKRLGLAHRVTQFLASEQIVPAVGQGALAIEIREDDPFTAPMAQALHHPDTGDAVAAERAFLSRIGGSCQIPVAAHATLSGDKLFLTALIADLSGAPLLRDSVKGARKDAGALGEDLAQRLMDRGGREILDKILNP